MRRRFGHLAPLAVAAFPALFYTSTNRGEFWPGETVAVVVLLLTIALAAYGVLRVVARRARPENVAAAAAVLVAWIFMSNMLADRLPAGVGRIAVKVAIAAGVLALVWRLLAGGQERRGLVRAVSVFALALVVPAALQTAYYEIADSYAAARSPFRHALEAPVPVRATAEVQQRRPDIYLLILDTFASPRVMQDFFGYDDHQFVDSLRSLGFHVPAVTASNYPYTAYSVASLLNMAYLTPVSAERRRTGKDVGILYALTRDNRVTRLLKERGYTVYFQPNTAYAGTRENADSDVLYGPTGEGGPVGWLRRSNLWQQVWAWSLLERLPRHLGRRDRSQRRDLQSFAAVAAVARRPGPKFVFLHSLLPHPPYMYDERCVARPTSRPTSDRAAYVALVRCVQQLTLRTVATVIRDSPTPPVIIIQGDHGSFPAGLPGRADSLTAPQVSERFGAFGAYRVPPGTQLANDDTVSVVNVFREALSDAVGADLPALPDSIYFPVDMTRHPLQFRALPDSFSAAILRHAGAGQVAGADGGAVTATTSVVGPGG